jgi:hypothetical protein
MAVHHSLYGLFLSANLPIPSLPVLRYSPSSEIRIHLKESSSACSSIFSSNPHFFYVSPNLDDDGQPNARVGNLGDRFFCFFYGSGARFAVRSDGREIWADGPEGYTVEDLATYLVGPVMGFVLRLLGMLPLHACAVAVEDRAIALVGSQGAGKSTTAAAFAKMGFAILSEDVVAVTEEGKRHMVQPGYPRVNLWPESAETIFGCVHGLPPVTPTWGKHFLALNDAQNRFQNEPLELTATFILRDRVPGALKPRIEKMAPATAMTRLVANTYVNYLLDAAMRQREFVQLSHLLRTTPVYQVWPPDDPSRVYELCQAISTEARACAARPILS